MIIFDLDQTLIDSSSVKLLRDRRKWNEVYPKIPQLLPYEGITELLQKLIGRVPIGIVTSSPKSYCQRIINHNNWCFDTVVCYHDTSNHKPHPAPILKAIESLECENKNVISIGDEAKDIIASRRAGVISIASLWGTSYRADLLGANPDYTAETVDALSKLLFEEMDILN